MYSQGHALHLSRDMVYTCTGTSFTLLTDFSLIAANSGLGAGRGTRLVAQAKFGTVLFLLHYASRLAIAARATLSELHIILDLLLNLLYEASLTSTALR